MTLGINIAYVFIERSLPREARIVTGLQVARRAHRQASGPREKDAAGFEGEVGRPLTPFSREHFKFVAISIKAIPAAFCKLSRSPRHESRMTDPNIRLPSTGFIAISQLLQAGVVGAYTSNLSEVSLGKWFMMYDYVLICVCAVDYRADEGND